MGSRLNNQVLWTATTACLVAVGSVQADTYTWTQTSTGGNWSAASWTATTPVEAADTVIRFFAGTSGGSNTVTADFTATNDIETAGSTSSTSFDLESLILSGTGTSRLVTINPTSSTKTFRFSGDANTLSFEPGSSLGYDVKNNIFFVNGLTVSSSSTNTAKKELAGTISGSGGLTINGPGRFSINASNNYTGGTIINGGTVILGNDASLGTSDLTLNGGALSNSGLFGSGDSNSRDLAVNVTFGGDFQIMNTSIQGGNYSLASATKTINLGGATRVISTDSFTSTNATSGSTVSFLGAVSNGGLTKSGKGGLRLSSASSSYTGVTTVRMGTLTIANNAPASANGALGNATSAVELGDASTSAANTINLFISGAFTVGRDINVNNFNNTGTTTIGGSADFDSTFSGDISLARAVALTSSTTGANAVNFTGDISGTNQGVDIIGGGNVTFATAAKTYTGATTVSSGKLTVNSLLANSNITIGGASAATLDGAGTLNFNLDNDTADLISVLNLGTLNIAGLTLAVDLTGVQTQAQYVVADYSAAGATLSGTQFANVAGLNGQWAVNYGTIVPDKITLDMIPEPASLAMLGLAGLCFFHRRRRHA